MSRWHTLGLLPALAGLWVLLSDAAWSSWLVGIPVVGAAAWVHARMRPAGGGFSPSGALRFVPFFAWQSVRGGLDVAGRVLGPKLRIAPGFSEYRTRLVHPGARLLFANSVSLLPGTLAADLNGDLLCVHALDVNSDFAIELRQVERAVGHVFGEAL